MKLTSLFRSLLAGLPLGTPGFEVPKWATRRQLLFSRIPASWFTKRGPGVTARSLEAFRSFDREDREQVVAWGWFPRHWLEPR